MGQLYRDWDRDWLGQAGTYQSGFRVSPGREIMPPGLMNLALR